MGVTRRSVLGTDISATAGFVGRTARAATVAPIRIGVLNDQSGPYSASMGPGSVIAAQMALEEFGPTVIGRPIEILAADHQNSVDIGTGIARQRCDTGGVGLILDIGHSAIALGVQDIVRDRNKVAIHSLEEEVRAAVGRNGGNVIGTVRHPEHTNDFSAYILQALAAKPQVLGLLNSDEDMANSLKQATEFGFSPGR